MSPTGLPAVLTKGHRRQEARRGSRASAQVHSSSSCPWSGRHTRVLSASFKLHGVEKNISFPTTVTQDGETVKIAATFDIKRKDFGIVYPGKAEDLIRDEVVIRLDLIAKPEA